MGRGMGIIRGRKCPKIQNCPRCGRMRVFHPDGYFLCTVPDEVLDRLREFRRANGVRWKSKLRELWLQGKDEGNLRNARNMIGPRQLDKINLDKKDGTRYSPPA